jgi:hypothetical protein
MGHEGEDAATGFEDGEETVESFDVGSFEGLLDGASGEVDAGEDIGAEEGEVAFLDVPFLLVGEGVSESEVEVGEDEAFVGGEEGAEDAPEEVAEMGDERGREEGDDPDGGAVEGVGEMLHH